MNMFKRAFAVFLIMILAIMGMPIEKIMASELGNQKDIISYVIVDSPYVQTPDTQRIIIGSQYAAEMDAVELSYSNTESGNTFSIGASEVTEEALMFEIDCTEQDAGVYQLNSIAYKYQKQDYLIEFSAIGIEAYYGVNTEVNTSPDAEIIDEDSEIETNIVSFDENGEQQSENSISEAISESKGESEEAIAANMSLIGKSYDSDRTVVVILDPGHDATHGGSHSSSGLQEADLTLKIAQYCYDELTQYQNVVVYMTRTTSGCPYPGTTSGEDNEKRVEFAKNLNADIYVSIHLNSSSSSSASGAEVYYPNGNYNSTASTIGKGVSESILTQLTALGLNNRGVKIRNSENGTTYEDGSLADYYGVIRNCKKSGITGIIVEHAFLSNTGDVASYLSSESQLKALGVADATGIANYYELSKSTTVYNGVDYAAVFDADYYYNNNADVAKSYGTNAAKLLEHFVNYGMSEGRQAIASFNVTSYKNRYKDLRQAYGDNLKSYYYHYINYGCAEGRVATGDVEITDGITTLNGTDYSAVYDYSYYIANNPDVANAYPDDDVAVLEHFVNFGMKEGRQAIASFNVNTYKNRYVDLRTAYMRDLPSYYMHYISFGKAEGRSGSGTASIETGITTLNGTDYSAVYDYNYYIQHYADLVAAYGNDDISILEHFVNCGMNEGRLAKSSFDVIAYKNSNKDLRVAFGNDLKAYFAHYINYGKSEGRVVTGSRTITDPITEYNGIDYSKVYDYNYYIQNNQDVYAVYGEDDISALQHFVTYGMSEGRQAKNTFNVYTYVANNQDLRAVFGENWEQYYLHYINYGYNEGRIAY